MKIYATNDTKAVEFSTVEQAERFIADRNAARKIGKPTWILLTIEA